jgi:hypothetical protein
MKIFGEVANSCATPNLALGGDGQLASHSCFIPGDTAFVLFILLLICGDGVEPSPLLLRPFIGPLYQPWMIDGYDCGAIGGMYDWQGKLKYSQQTCPSATLSTTNPTCPELGFNLGHRGD